MYCCEQQSTLSRLFSTCHVYYYVLCPFSATCCTIDPANVPCGHHKRRRDYIATKTSPAFTPPRLQSELLAQAPPGSVDAGLRDASCGRCRGVGTSTASKWRSPRQQPACGRISARHSPRPLGHRAVRARDAQSTSSRGVGGCHRRPGKQHCAGPPTPRPPREVRAVATGGGHSVGP